MITQWDVSLIRQVLRFVSAKFCFVVVVLYKILSIMILKNVFLYRCVELHCSHGKDGKFVCLSWFGLNMHMEHYKDYTRLMRHSHGIRKTVDGGRHLVSGTEKTTVRRNGRMTKTKHARPCVATVIIKYIS